MRISDWSSDVCSSDLQDSTVIDEDVSGGPAPAHKEPETRDDAISKALDEAEAKTKEPAANGDAEESEEGEPVTPAKADKADKDAKDETDGDEGEQDEDGDEKAAQPKDRSKELGVGKGWVGMGEARCAPLHTKTKKTQ